MENESNPYTAALVGMGLCAIGILLLEKSALVGICLIIAGLCLAVSPYLEGENIDQ